MMREKFQSRRFQNSLKQNKRAVYGALRDAYRNFSPTRVI